VLCPSANYAVETNAACSRIDGAAQRFKFSFGELTQKNAAAYVDSYVAI